MECFEVSEQLDAWLDGECDAKQALEIQLHVDSCSACQLTVKQRRAFDIDLDQALAADRGRAPLLVDRVLGQLDQTSSAVSRFDSSGRQSWFSLLVAAAAGFLLAMSIFGSRPRESGVADPILVTTASRPQARLTATTGRVELFNPADDEWREVPPLRVFSCPTDSALRTSPDASCEIETKDGYVVRLNDETEVSFVDSHIIELRRGQMWCKASEKVALEVRVLPPQTTSRPKHEPHAKGAIRCDVGPSGEFSCAQSNHDIHMLNAAGDVNISTATNQRQLNPGEAAQFSNGQLQESESRIDPILSTRWIHPLLAQKGADDSELQGRVNEMLARLGEEKLARLFEQEIRALGEHAAWPLVRFVNSPLSANDAERRLKAMRLANDLSPVWLIPEFIELLEDANAEIRTMAAAALLRLTGLNMDLEPAQWRAQSAASAEALARWHQWWQENQGRFPTPALRLDSVE